MPSPTPPSRAMTGLLGLAAAATTLLVIVPLGRLGWAVLGDGHPSVGRVLTAPGAGRAAVHSLTLAVLVPLLAVPLGTATALALRHEVPLRSLLRLLVLLPLLVPQFVLGYSWTQAYGRAGFTDDLLGVHWDGLLGPGGVVAVLVVDAVPVTFLLVTVGLATRAQPELEAAARTAGATRWAVLRTVVLPLLRPVLVAATVLTFVATLESFAVPQVLGTPAGYSTLTTRLYADLALGSDPAAFTDAVTIALVLALVALVLVLPADVLVTPRFRSGRAALPGRSGGGRRPGGIAGALLVAAYAVLGVVLPTVALLAASVTRAVGLPPTPGNWTLDNFRAALDAPTRDALGHSVALAFAAAVTVTLLGVVVVAVERRGPGRVVATLPAVTFAVPGSALAVGLLVAYGGRLGGTFTIILLAYLAKFWALAHRAVSGAADRVPDREWQAARVSGAGVASAVRTVWVPAMAPALVAAAVAVFAASLHEVTMSSLLYSTGTETFAVAVLNSQELGDTATTAALSVVLTVVILAVTVPAVIAVRTLGRAREREVARVG